MSEGTQHQVGGYEMKGLSVFLAFLVLTLVIVIAVKTANPNTNSIQHHITNADTNSKSPIQNENCLYPGYGEVNDGSVTLDEKGITANVGERVETNGTITGKMYNVGENGKSSRPCYYDGNMTLRAYLGPKMSKSSWSYMSGKLRSVNGTMNITVEPSTVYLAAGGTVNFRVNIAPKKKGVYCLYIVAFGESGWKSWDFIEVDVK